MVKSMRLIPTNTVGQAWIPREACYDQERGQSKVEKDTVTLNEKQQGEVHPRMKDKTPNATWMAFGVRGVRLQVWRAMLLSSLSTSRPRRIGWLHGEVDAIDFRPAKEADCCGSHVKRVLTDTGGVWRAERHCRW